MKLALTKFDETLKYSKIIKLKRFYFYLQFIKKPLSFENLNNTRSFALLV